MQASTLVPEGLDWTRGPCSRCKSALRKTRKSKKEKGGADTTRGGKLGERMLGIHHKLFILTDLTQLRPQGRAAGTNASQIMDGRSEKPAARNNRYLSSD